MTPGRRTILHAGAAVGLLGATGCDGVISWVAKTGGQEFPDEVANTAGANIDPDFHLLSRAAFGPWPGDVARVREMGRDAWIEEQLHPDRINDRLCDLRARRFESLHISAGELLEYKKPVVREELTRATLLRAVYSKRQLLEVMVRFWSDHLNIDTTKDRCAHFKTADDRDVVRKHALGRFRDLIGASALSPAMLVYLDGTENKRRNDDEKPNENYARELLELHTLGVDGGYSQDDVMEAARCLTGWRVRKKWKKGRVVFDASAHDDGEKTVLGRRIGAGGKERDLDRLLDIVCAHPSTARFIATKLCRRFVADDPPAALVAQVAKRFEETDGDIKALLRTILGSDEFQASRGTRLKRPFRFVVSALRAMAADTHAKKPLLRYLERLGQPLFQYPTPDGYSDDPAPWMGTLLWRWNFAFALTGGDMPSVKVDLAAAERALSDIGPPSLERAFSYLVGRAPRDAESSALEAAWRRDRTHAFGLMLSTPAFQRY